MGQDPSHLLYGGMPDRISRGRDSRRLQGGTSVLLKDKFQDEVGAEFLAAILQGEVGRSCPGQQVLGLP